MDNKKVLRGFTLVVGSCGYVVSWDIVVDLSTNKQTLYDMCLGLKGIILCKFVDMIVDDTIF